MEYKASALSTVLSLWSHKLRVYFFGFLVTPGDPRDLLWALRLRIIPGRIWGTIWVTGIELRLAVFKASALLIEPSLQPLILKNINIQNLRVRSILQQVERVFALHTAD